MEQDEKTTPWFYDINDFANKHRLKMMKGQKTCCPTCGRHNQIYRRKLGSAMARQLITLHRLQNAAFAAGDPNPWIHASELVLKGTSGQGDFSKLKHWGLIEPMPHEPCAKKFSGKWRITPAGKKFVHGRTRLKPYALLLNDRLLELTGDSITITQALTTEFNYQELLSGNTVVRPATARAFNQKERERATA